MVSRNINNMRRLHKKTIKDLISEEVIFSYEKAAIFSDQQIDKQIKNEEEKFSELDQKYAELPFDSEINGGNNIPSDEQMDVLVDMSEVDYAKSILQEQKFSLKEMQIIYLYKSYEINIKELIKTAFPNENNKDLFKWETLKDFFKVRDIGFTTINEYQLINQLRMVNNNIKHSSEIDEKVKKMDITEFNDLNYFDYDSLNTFYERVKLSIVPFLKNIADNITSHLFDFNDERILNIAKSYSENMDDSTLKRLAKALEKESQEGNNYPVMGDLRE